MTVNKKWLCVAGSAVGVVLVVLAAIGGYAMPGAGWETEEKRRDR